MLSDMNYGRAKRIAATMDHNSVSQTELFDGLLDSDPVKRKWIIFLELKVKWRLSEYGKSSAKTIKGILKRKDTVVTQAMCLGLGAMDYDTDECTYCFNQGDCDQGCYKQARSFAQLAAFSSWVDLLSKCHDYIFLKLIASLQTYICDNHYTFGEYPRPILTITIIPSECSQTNSPQRPKCQICASTSKIHVSRRTTSASYAC